MSRSKWCLRAFSRDCTTISLSVNSRAVRLISCCSSVRSKSIPLLSWLLGCLPGSIDASLDLRRDAVDRKPLLREGVAVAQRQGAVLDALVVDRKAKRRAD